MLYKEGNSPQNTREFLVSDKRTAKLYGPAHKISVLIAKLDV